MEKTVCSRFLALPGKAIVKAVKTVALAVACLCAPLFAADYSASLALGQATLIDNVVSSSANFYEASGVAIGGGRVYAADYYHNRVLWWASTAAYYNGRGADGVIGQADFGHTGYNRDRTYSPKPNSLFYPRGIAVDASSNVWVADYNNHRVLRFPEPQAGVDSVADLVLGQNSFYTRSFGTTEKMLYYPFSVAVDTNGYVWVADYANNRVLRFSEPATGASADLVLGQTNFTTRTSGHTATTLNVPFSVDIDSNGYVWVADYGNNRILRYTEISTGAAADLVLGQPNFTARVASCSAANLYHPDDVALDPGGSVWVADYGNNRVLRYTTVSSGAAAAVVLGQADFVSSNTNRGGDIPAGDSLALPRSIALDSSGGLWTADTNNSRVLKYDADAITGASATLVLGQVDLVDGSTRSITSQLMYNPYDSVAGDGRLYISDYSNHRVLWWEDASGYYTGRPADGVIGQADFMHAEENRNQTTTAADRLSYPRGMAVDASGNLWLSDGGNNRVLRFPRPAAGVNAVADLVLGQADFVSRRSNRGTGVAANTLALPVGLAFDAVGNLWVSDRNNNRVLRFPAPGASGIAADRVIGQENFTSNRANRTDASTPDSNTLYAPYGLALDAGGNVWVGDYGNNRVLRFPSPEAGADTSADLVLGQDGFTTNAAGTSVVTLNRPVGVAQHNGSVWVADDNNSRVLKYTLPSENGQPAALVLGQADFDSNVYNRGLVTPAANSLNYPRGVSIDAEGNVWITDSGNHRTVRYQVPASTYAISGLISSDTSTIAGVTLNISGSTVTSVVTDALGKFSVTLEAGGVYTVTPSTAVYNFYPKNFIAYPLGSDEKNVEFSVANVISGSVTASGTGLPGVTMELTGNIVLSTMTDSSGAYSFTVPRGGVFTVTPAIANYGIAPVSLSTSGIENDWAGVDFAATLNNYVVSGSVTVNGAGLSGATVTVSGGTSTSAVTGADGAFTFTLPAQGDYVFTPTRADYYFLPSTITLGFLSEDHANVDFIAAHIAGGTVTVSGAPLADTVINITGGTDMSVVADSSGVYITTLPAGVPYQFTPWRPNYTFAPVSYSTDAFMANWSDQLFFATLNNYVVSGSVTLNGAALSGATVTVSGSSDTFAVTDEHGAYSFTLPGDGDYTFMPSYDGYAFSPASVSTENLSGAFAADSFTAGHVISGSVTVDAAGLANVSIMVSGGTSTVSATADDGSFSITLPVGGAYTLTPARANYSFSPVNIATTALDADWPDNIFTAILADYVVSGSVTVSGVGVAGATVTVSGSSETFALTDEAGSYWFTLPGDGNYTLTPQLGSYGFAPVFASTSALSGDWTGNTFAASYVISGSVTVSGTGVANVAVTVSGSSDAYTLTDAGGSYWFSLPAHGDYTITPSHINYTFEPGAASFQNVSANMVNTDFEAALNDYVVSGTITVAGVGLAGTTVTVTGSAATFAVANSSGFYSLSLPGEGTYTLTPAREHYLFTPDTLSTATLSGNLTAGFTAALDSYVVSGSVTVNGAGVAGASVTVSGDSGGFVLTEPDGSYSFTLVALGSYTVTPALPNYVFAPVRLTTASLTGNWTGNNFAGEFRGFAVSGVVTLGGQPAAGVNIMVGGDASVSTQTAADGSYLFNLPANGNYTIAPYRDNYTFSPESISTNTLSSDWSGNDFAGTLNDYIISGSVTLSGAGVAGATVTVSGGTDTFAVTDAAGFYSLLLPGDTNYTLTPSYNGYRFAPEVFSVSLLSQGYAGVTFAAAYAASGSVTVSGVGFAGATVTVSGSTSTSVLSGADGSYAVNLPAGGSYTLTPVRLNYTFSPVSVATEALAGDWSGNGFAGTLDDYVVSGSVTVSGVGLPGATITVSGALSTSTLTDAGGFYSFLLPGDTDYTLTPYHKDYVFAPAELDLPLLSADAPNTDFVGGNMVSGSVTVAGTGLDNVTLTITGTASATVTTDENGFYSVVLPPNGAYTFTPSRTNYTFSPVSASTAELVTNWPDNNFTATLNNYVVSGSVTLSGAAVVGATVTVSGGTSTFALTDVNGAYSLLLPGDGDYYLTPSYQSYVFFPESLSTTTLSGDWGGNNFATARVVSGSVTVNGLNLADVVINVSGSTSVYAMTDAEGGYTLNLPIGGSYTLMPWRSNYTFEPVAISTEGLLSDWRYVDFAATLNNYPVSGSVTANGLPLTGATVTVSGSTDTFTLTGDDGAFSVLLPGDGTYTLAPAYTGYSFIPASYSSVTLSGAWSGNSFMAGHTASGSVTVGGTALDGVQLNVSGSTDTYVYTDEDGHYSLVLPTQGGYTLTPYRRNYTFDPVALSTAGLSGDWAGEFAATLNNYVVSGSVTLEGLGVGGVTVTVSGSSSTFAVTGADGSYSFTLPGDGSYTLTPSLAYHTFDPASASTATLSGNWTGNDFVASRIYYTASGSVMVAGAPLAETLLTVSGSTDAVTQTDSNGLYSLLLPAAGSYTLTPSSANYLFTPVNVATAMLAGAWSNNFTAVFDGYVASGSVTVGGVGLAGTLITVDGSGSFAVTDASGSYALQLPRAGSYALTPSRDNYTFTPVSISTVGFCADWPGNNFIGLVNDYMVSGYVTADGTGLAGATVTVSGGASTSTLTDAEGFYQFTLPGDADYTLTASYGLYSFIPAVLSTETLSDNWGNADFYAGYLVSGSVTVSGAGLADVRISVTDSSDTYVMTGVDGSYSMILPAGGGYTLTPSRANYAFEPLSLSTAALAADWPASFAAVLNDYVVSGSVTVAGAGVEGTTITVSGSSSAFVLTDSNGSYSFLLPAEGNYTFTPSHDRYSFLPASFSITGLSGNSYNNNFYSGYLVSGSVTVEGAGLAGATVTVSGSSSTFAVTGADGSFFTVLPPDGDYTLTPYRRNYTFAPVSLTTAALAADWTGNAFTATLNNYIVSGSVTVNGAGLEGATVTVSGSSGTFTLTDADGSFSFTLPGDGTYTFTPSYTGYAFAPDSVSTMTLSGAWSAGAFAAGYVASGSVTLSGEGLAGAEIMVSGSTSTVVFTDADGLYSLVLLTGGSYTLTPILQNYTFSPASVSTTALAADWASAFTATLNTYVVSGSVTVNGAGLAGATVTVSGGASTGTVTDEAGAYYFTLDAASGYTLTPSYAGYVFLPGNVSTGSLSGNWSGNDFAAGHVASGSVTVEGAGLAGATVTVSGSANAFAVTDSSGSYYITLAAQGGYTLTPVKEHYTFEPVTASTASLMADWVSSFSATLNNYVASGSVTVSGVGIAGATVTVSGSTGTFAVTDSSGSYYITLAAAGNYTLTPALAYYTFSPEAVSTETLSGNWAGNNFTAERIYHTVSGSVTVGGAPLPQTLVSVTGDTVVSAETDAEGVYSFTLAAGGNYTFTPSRQYYLFEPVANSTAELSADWTGNDFDATFNGFTVSGSVTAGGFGLAGATVTVFGSSDTFTVTDASGSYFFVLPASGSYTLAAERVNYMLEPAEISTGSLVADWTGNNFEGTVSEYIVAGAVIVNGAGLAGATVTVSGGASTSTVTDNEGSYYITLAGDSDYTITPSYDGYVFLPAALSTVTLSSDWYDNVFTAAHTASGTITVDGIGFAGATVTVSGSTETFTVTDSSGFYSVILPAEGSYTLTPSRVNYTFEPVSLSTTALAADWAAGFTAALNQYLVTGSVTVHGAGLEGATVTVSGSSGAFVLTDVNGSYSFLLFAEGNYTFTPAYAGYSFAPASVSTANLSGPWPAGAFTAGYVVSGSVTAEGVGLAGVAVGVSGSTATTAVTGADGSFFAVLPADGSCTLTPYRRNYTFAPVSLTTAALAADWTGNAFTATLNNYIVSGSVTVNGAGLAGATVTVSGSSGTFALTDSNGAYSFTLPGDGTYTLTPSHDQYVFLPASVSSAVLSGDWTGNDFTPAHVVSGTVMLGGGGLSEVDVMVSGSSTTAAVTDESGAYSLILPDGGDYTLTPILQNYTFSPASVSTTALAADWASAFTATLNTYVVSGSVTVNGAALAGATVTVSGGASTSTVTDEAGAYYFTLDAASGYTLTPSYAGYVFLPASAATETLSGDWYGNDFAAGHIISGSVTVNGAGLENVEVTVSGSTDAFAVTDFSGSYYITLAAQGGYTLTPVKEHYTFEPVTASTASLMGDWVNSFSATLNNYLASGSVTLEGVGVGGVTVTVSGSTGTFAVTDSSGSYYITLAAEGNYTLTPALAYYTFNPVNVSTWGLSGNWSDNNFSAERIYHTVSGSVTFEGAPLPGTLISVTGDTVTSAETDAEGVYSFTLAAGGTYTLTPSRHNYGFAPVSLTTAALAANWTGGDFAAEFAGYTVSGSVTAGGFALAGATVTVFGSSDTFAVTDASGAYSFLLPAELAYTFVPYSANYWFDPDVSSTETLTADWPDNNFAGTLYQYTVSGVVSVSGAGVAGATVTVSGSASTSTLTDADGYYEFTLDGNGSYTLTPSYQSYAFAPPALSTVTLSANWLDNDFAAGYAASGTITAGGAALAGATVTVSGSIETFTVTDSSGAYSLMLPLGGSYTLTPSRRNYGFEPASVSTAALEADWLNDFAATPNSYLASGSVTAAGVGLEGATVTVSGSTDTFAVTDAAGSYYLTLAGDGDYTLTPSRAHYTFSPVSLSTSVLSSSWTGNDFAGTLNEYAASGSVTVAGVGIEGATVTVSGDVSAFAVTDASGSYSLALPAEGAYTLTPVRANYTFEPVSLSTGFLAGDWPGNAFAGTLNNYVISGSVTVAGAGLVGATVTVSGSSSTFALTDINGAYSFTLPAEGNYTLAASHDSYAFLPAALSTITLSGDWYGNTFTAGYAASGSVTVSGAGLAGATVTVSGSTSAFAVTDASGAFSLVLPIGGDYILTPARRNYTFEPVNVTTTGLAASWPGNDFAGTLNNYLVSGSVTVNGLAFAGVTVTVSGSSAAFAMTDESGAYSFTLPGDGDYTLTPAYAASVFSPASASTVTLSANWSGNNFAVGSVASGTITSGGIALDGVTVMVSGSTDTFAVTDAGGAYSLVLPLGGGYTLTPYRRNYTFGPASVSTGALAADWLNNFTAELNSYVISGSVTAEGAGLAGTTVTVSGSTDTFTVTDSGGAYAFTLPGNGDYTLTPSRDNYTFSPVSLSTESLSANWTGGDFEGTLNNYVISGAVMVSGFGLEGATITVSGSTEAVAVTDANGEYSLTLPGGGDYILTPYRRNYTFSPVSLSTAALAADWAADVFAAELNNYMVSGSVTVGGAGLAGATVTVSGSSSTFALTGLNGEYSFTLPGDGDYTITPAYESRVFAPASVSTVTLSANWTDNNFAAGYVASGSVTVDGAGLAGVTVTVSGGASAYVVTNADGSYSFILPADGDYTLTPYRRNYTFAPVSVSTMGLAADWTGNAFAGALNNYVVSGSVTVAGAGVMGATVTVSGSSDTFALTDANGAYAFTLPGDGDYTLTPSYESHAFAPASASTITLSADWPGNNFAAGYVASGTVTVEGAGLAGTTVTVSGGVETFAVTDSSGVYSLVLPLGLGYTLAPYRRNYSFEPANASTAALAADWVNAFAGTLNNYVVSGSVTAEGAGLAGATVTVSGSTDTFAVTDAAGSYYITLAGDGSYTLTPSRAHYTFSPVSLSTSILSSSWTGNDFAGTPDNYVVSGSVTVGGAGLAGVTVTVSGSTDTFAVTDASGAYALALAAEGAYTLTPSLANYTFAPVSLSTGFLAGNWPGNDFAGTLNSFVAGGTITVGGAGLAGATVTVSGSTNTFTVTDASGAYSFSLAFGGDYTITPARRNYTFAPASVSTAGLSADWFNDFTAELNNYVVSGSVTLDGLAFAGVTVTVSGSSDTFALTDLNGAYSFTLPGDGDYTLTPSRLNYTFSPVSLSTSVLSSSWTGNAFAAATVPYVVSGSVTVEGAGLAGVTITVSGSTDTFAVTDEAGSYSFTLYGDGDYTLTPSRLNYTFSPVTVSTTALSADWTGNTFAATLNAYVVSGSVTVSGAGLAGATVTVSGSSDTFALTDLNGAYSFTLPGNGDYTLTPSYAGYVFSPAALSTAALSGDWTGNTFTAGYVASGSVTVDGAALAGATVTVAGSASAYMVTGADGAYSFVLPAGGDYTLTPYRRNYTFAPVSVSTTGLAASWSGNDFAGTLNNYVISGSVTVNGAGLYGATVTVSGSSSAFVLTDLNGAYSFTLPGDGDYTFTPAYAGRIFTPASASTVTLSDNWSANNFAAAYIISGSVTLSGAGFAGATVTVSGSTSSFAVTGADGGFAFTLPEGGAYTLTPARVNYTFSPASVSTGALAADWTDNNFAGTLNTYVVSGSVTAGGIGLEGATVTVSGSSSAFALTDASGAYSFTLDGDGSYTLTPYRRNYTFSPVSLSTEVLSADWTDNNFAGTLNNYMISGSVTVAGAALAGATVAVSGSSSAFAVTDASGSYSVTLPGDGDYTLTPYRLNYTFSPVSVSTTALSADWAGNAFAGTLNNYVISGSVTVDGAALAGATVTVSGSSGTFAVTDASGAYAFTLPGDGDYTLTPYRLNYTFSPVSLSTAVLSADWADNNFAGTLNFYTVSGSVTVNGLAFAGVTVTVSGSSSTFSVTDSSGAYAFTLPGDGSYTFTPSRANYAFEPASLSTAVLSGDWTAASFAGAAVPYVVSGSVTVGGFGFAGVTVTVSGSTDAFSVTDASGSYSFLLAAEGAYTLTPSRDNYTFDPVSVSTALLQANWPGNDFSGTLNDYVVSGSVTVDGAALAGATVTVSGSSNTFTVTGADGAYAFTLPAEGAYSVTPQKEHYTFVPSEVSTASLSGAWQNAFAGVLNIYVVSGSVTVNGAGLAGATVTVSGSSNTFMVTGADGAYSFALPALGGYTLTPSRRNYTFSPVSLTTASLETGWTGSSFAAAPVPYIASGSVTVAGIGLEGATVTVSGSSSAFAVTDASGAYSFTLDGDGSYILTPYRRNYTFSPVSLSTSVLSADWADNNFAGTLNNYMLSGSVTVNGLAFAGVTVTVSGSSSAFAVTDSSGAYAFTLPGDGDYTLTPYRRNYSFSPISLSTSVLSGNLAAVNFAGAAVPYVVSGSVTVAGIGLEGTTITVSGSTDTFAVTDSSGAYSLTLDGDGDYTLTPYRRNYTFSPVSLSTEVLSADWSGADFAAALNNYLVSGLVTRDSEGFAGTTITVSGSTDTFTVTDVNGAYSFTLPGDGTYVFTPSRDHYTFDPAVISTAVLSGNIVGNNFAASVMPYAVSGSVTVNGLAFAGATVTVSGSSNTFTVSGADGSYFLSLPGEGSYTLTPSRDNYTFSPVSLSTASLAADWSGNDFAGTLNYYTVSGSVTVNGLAFEGVTVTVSGSSSTFMVTGADGAYSFTLPGDANYTLTPRRVNYTFAPVSVTTAVLSGAWVNNFAAALNNYVVSGSITVNGIGLAGTTVTVSGSSSTFAVTASNGVFSFLLPAEGNYTLAPARINYTFDKVSVATSGLAGAWTGNNFAATVNTYQFSGTILSSGSVPLAGVRVAVTGSLMTTVLTDSSGHYSLTLPGEGDYTLTPSLEQYTFNPASRSTTTLSGNWTGNDFTGLRASYTIAGRITAAGAALANVSIAVTGSTVAAVVTDAAGNYSIALPAGTYTLTPVLTGYFMVPAYRSVALTDVSVAGMDFGAGQTAGRVAVPVGGPNGYAQPSRGYPAKIRLVEPKESGHVVIQLFTQRGARLVYTLETDVAAGTPAEVVWNGINTDGQSVGSGLYIAVINGAGYVNEKVRIGVLK